MPQEDPEDDSRRFVRFDFPPGAGPKEIAEAIEAARKKVMAAKAERDRQAAEAAADGERQKKP
jgi:hypothetical protein